MTQKLDIKRILRVALVDKGDNPEAEVVIHKRFEKQPTMSDVHVDTTDALYLCASCNKKSKPDANGMCKECGKPMVVKAQSFADMAAQREVLDDFYEMTDLLNSVIYSITCDDTVTDKPAAIKQSIDEFAAALKSKLGTPMEKNEKVGLLKNIMQAIGLGDGDVEVPAVVVEPNKDTTVEKNDTAEDVTKAEVEALRKRAEELEKARAEADEKFAKLQEEREVEQFSKQAEAYKGVPGITADFGKVLRKISKALTPDEMKAFEASLAGAAEAIRRSADFEEIGKDGKVASTAEAKIEEAAQNYMKADAKLTKEQAIAKVLVEQPALYNEYRQSKPGATSD